MTEWFDRDDFWIQLEPFFFSHIRNPASTAHEVRGAMKLLSLKPGQSLLDLCCGTGRHLLTFSARGLRVTGVDRTRAYLEKAGRAADKHKRDVHFVLSDIRRFRKENTFDAAVNLFSSFGYFRDQRHDFEVLRNVHASLKPGGRFLLDLMGRHVLKRKFREKNTYHDDQSGDYLVQTAVVNSRWSWVEQTWLVVRGSHQRTYKFGLRIYSGDEITKALKDAGFESVTLYGSFRGAPYDDAAERLIAVAQKAGKDATSRLETEREATRQ